jgi:hypothetical protein
MCIKNSNFLNIFFNIAEITAIISNIKSFKYITVLYFNSRIVSMKINKIFSGNKLISWNLLLFIQCYYIAQETVCVLNI